MIAQAALRRGWCPGALTPMQTGDGWLVRVRPRAGRFSLSQLSAIARAAHDCSNGEIDLTNRANLQIRGLSPETITHAQRILAQAGLIDDDAVIEARRNIVVSPLAGLDPQSTDVADLALALEQALRQSPGLEALPGKFGFALDAGGAIALGGGIADITLRAAGQHVEIVLAGDSGIAAAGDGKSAVPAAVRLAEVFARHAASRSALRRMRDLVAEVGAARILRFANLPIEPATRIEQRPNRLPIGMLGPTTRPWAYGVGLPFGRISAQSLDQLIAVLAAAGISEVRPSPSRILILPAHNENIADVFAGARAAGLIVTEGDPRLTMDVCPGAPACARGTTLTRRDAETIAVDFPHLSTPIHVSGCAKGCARSSAAGVTLVARNGRYDIVQNGDVTAAPIATDIAPTALRDVVAQLLGASHG